MKNFIIIFVLLMISSPLFSEEIFFECTVDPIYFNDDDATYMNISFDQDNNTGSLESDFMGSSTTSNRWKTLSITKTSDEVVFTIDVGPFSPILTSWAVNRSTLQLTQGNGIRTGQCKIIEKKNKF